MGAASFSDVMWRYSYNEMRKAFDDAVEQATFEYGHGIYNGSINTTYLCGMSPHGSSRPVGYDEAYDLIKNEYDNINKGESYGIFVYKKEWNYRESLDNVEIEVSLHTSEIEQLDYCSLEDAMKVVAKKKANEKLSKMLSKKSNPLGVEYRGKQLVGTFSGFGTTVECNKKIESSAHTATTEGARETRYFIAKVGSAVVQPWENGYTTQAQARKNLPKTMNSNDKYEIYGVTRRASGEGLVSHESTGLKPTTIKCTVRGRVDLHELYENKNETGWMFYGWTVC